MDTDNSLDINRDSESLASHFEVLLDEESTGFVFPDSQQTTHEHLESEEEEEKSYAPWTSEAEWELVH